MRINITFIAVLVVFGLFGSPDAALAQVGGTLSNRSVTLNYEVSGASLERHIDRGDYHSYTGEIQPGPITISGTATIDIPPAVDPTDGQTATSRNLALGKPAQQSSRSQWSKPNDPQGAVDGVKNGSYGFHTNNEVNPWWQVDLGAVSSFDEIAIYNRMDHPERSRNIRVLLSNDGSSWRTAYTHDGTNFGGIRGTPLRVRLAGERARFVRLQLADKTWLHLDEVEVLVGSSEQPPSTAVTEPPPSVAARFTVEAGKRTLSQGGSVTVPVSLNNVDGLANMNVNVHYDPAVVRPARNAARGNIIPQALFEANVRDRGVIRLGFAQQTDIRGTGTLAQIPFEAVGRPGTRTPLRLEVTMASAAAGSRVTPAQLIHGEIVIVGADGRLPGDTSGSGSLTALDAMNALKMSVGNLAVDMVADVDRDGRVTARDATLILQQVVGR